MPVFDGHSIIKMENKEKRKKPKVLVGCPTYDGKEYCLKEYVDAVKNLDYDNYDVVLVDNSKTNDYFERIQSFGIKSWHANPGNMPKRAVIATCRNLLRKLTIEDYDFFLSLEQDVIPPKDIITKLLLQRKRVISAVYNMVMDDGKKMPLLWRFLEKEEIEKLAESDPKLKEEIDNIKSDDARFCKRYEEGELPKNEVIKIAACGLGAVMIHKSVLKKVAFQHQSDKEAYDDMFFCRDVLRSGFEIYADTSVLCEHYQEKEFMPK